MDFRWACPLGTKGLAAKGSSRRCVTRTLLTHQDKPLPHPTSPRYNGVLPPRVYLPAKFFLSSLQGQAISFPTHMLHLHKQANTWLILQVVLKASCTSMTHSKCLIDFSYNCYYDSFMIFFIYRGHFFLIYSSCEVIIFFKMFCFCRKILLWNALLSSSE